MKKRILSILLALSLLISVITVFPICAFAEANDQNGDVNRDGYVNSADARLILRYANGSISLNKTQIRAGDVSKNDVLNVKDIDYLWLLMANNRVQYPNYGMPNETAGKYQYTLSEDSIEDSDTSIDETTSGTTLESTTSLSKKATTKSSVTKETTVKEATGEKTSKETKATTEKKTTIKTTKPTTKATAKTTKKTTKKTTVATTKVPTGKASVQKFPTMKAVTSPSTPSLKTSTVDESKYMNKIVVRNKKTGKVYKVKTKADLQLAVTADVKYELGSARNASSSTEAWKAHAVTSYSRMCKVCYDGTEYVISMANDVDLTTANDKKIYNAVGEVLGIKLMDTSASSEKGKLCDIFYHSSAAGTTSSCCKVYVQDLPHCRAVFSPETESLANKYYGSDAFVSTYTASMDSILADVTDVVGSKVYVESKSGYYPLYATEWDGSYVARCNLYYYSGDKKVYVKGTQIRSALGLRSHAFHVVSQSGDKITLEVKGYGHGVGMSQIGAVIYANEYGWNYKQILAHYFSITSSSDVQLCSPKW